MGVFSSLNRLNQGSYHPNKGSKQKRVTVHGRAQALPVSTSSGRSLSQPRVVDTEIAKLVVISSAQLSLAKKNSEQLRACRRHGEAHP